MHNTSSAVKGFNCGLVCSGALQAYKEYTWHLMSFLRPEVTKQNRTTTFGRERGEGLHKSKFMYTVFPGFSAGSQMSTKKKKKKKKKKSLKAHKGLH